MAQRFLLVQCAITGGCASPGDGDPGPRARMDRKMSATARPGVDRGWVNRMMGHVEGGWSCLVQACFHSPDLAGGQSFACRQPHARIFRRRWLESKETCHVAALGNSSTLSLRCRWPALIVVVVGRWQYVVCSNTSSWFASSRAKASSANTN